MSGRDELKKQLRVWGESHDVKAEEERKQKAREEAARAVAIAKERAEKGLDLSDEELFLKAVAGVEKSDAILQKYDRSDPGLKRPPTKKAEPDDIRDQALFLQYVEEMTGSKNE